MAWTDIPDSVLEPGKPIRSVDGIALRDNPIAIANGNSGAPKIQTAALDSQVVTTAKIANGNVTAQKLATTSSEVSWVAARITGMALGAVGTYVMATTPTGSSTNPGSQVSGSSLTYSSAAQEYAGSASLSGTWRCCGFTGNNSPVGDRATLWLRIS